MLKRLHPIEAELFEHAECLLARRVPFDSKVARHVASCTQCREEIDLVLQSLDVVNEAPQIEPGRNLEASILLSAKSRRHAIRLAFLPNVSRASLVRLSALAACVLAMMSTILHPSTANDPLTESISPVADSDTANEILTAGFSLEALTRATAEEELLGAALTSPAWVPSSRWERAQTRALSTLENDIDAAIEAYKNNPALVRAGAVVNANRERKKEISKTLYANRNL